MAFSNESFLTACCFEKLSSWEKKYPLIKFFQSLILSCFVIEGRASGNGLRVCLCRDTSRGNCCMRWLVHRWHRTSCPGFSIVPQHRISCPRREDLEQALASQDCLLVRGVRSSTGVLER